MYLSMLSQDEKIAFYSLAHALALSHGGVSDKEEQILTAALREMDMAHPADVLSVADACRAFGSKAAVRVALFELMLVALVDEDFAQEEEAVMLQIAQHLGILSAELERAASWAEGILALHRQVLRYIRA